MELIDTVIGAICEIKDVTNDALDGLARMRVSGVDYGDLVYTSYNLSATHLDVCNATVALERTSNDLFMYIRDEHDKEIFGMTASEARNQQAAKSA